MLARVVSSTDGQTERGFSHRWNQDRMICDPTHGVFLVLDGHGYGAEDVLDREEFTSDLAKRIGQRQHSVAQVLRDFDRDLQAADPTLMHECGCTVSGVHIGPLSLTVFNVGDSKTVVTDKTGHPVFSTRDHVPLDEDEFRRITVDCGGSVTALPHDVGRVAGVLAVSRSLGDWALRDQGVVCEADCTKCVAKQGHGSYIVMMTDGVWGHAEFETTWAIIEAHLASRQPQTPDEIGAAEHALFQELSAGGDDRSMRLLYVPDTRFRVLRHM